MQSDTVPATEKKRAIFSGNIAIMDEFSIILNNPFIDSVLYPTEKWLLKKEKDSLFVISFF
ncbi:hypothetical protein QBS70_03755 [Cronobacter sakazakii]|nr:hypothetical protein [Cronobacter sakazakii]